MAQALVWIPEQEGANKKKELIWRAITGSQKKNFFRILDNWDTAGEKRVSPAFSEDCSSENSFWCNKRIGGMPTHIDHLSDSKGGDGMWAFVAKFVYSLPSSLIW
ncbi:hypothetical protein ACJX0J_007951 [Zea mays]